jgi:hypothetical protein
MQVMWRLGCLKIARGFMRATNLFMVTDTEKKKTALLKLCGQQNSVLQLSSKDSWNQFLFTTLLIAEIWRKYKNQ